jgi:hypothetical protein
MGIYSYVVISKKDNGTILLHFNSKEERDEYRTDIKGYSYHKCIISKQGSRIFCEKCKGKNCLTQKLKIENIVGRYDVTQKNK